MGLAKYYTKAYETTSSFLLMPFVLGE